MIELLVVLVIIGVMITGAVIAFSGGKSDAQLEREGKRLEALLAYTREQAEIQTREFGLRVESDGYQFVVLEMQSGQWAPVDQDSALRRREWPGGLIPSLVVEGRQIVLKPRPPVEEFTPQVLLFSTGDVSSFELSLVREGTNADVAARLFNDDAGEIRLVLPGDPPPQVVASTS